MTRLLFSLFVFLLLAATPARAADPELGPAVGSAIPHALDAEGQPGFDTLTGENGLVLFFVRSVDWCPYCKNQVINISGAATAFAERGYTLAYLSYDSVEKQAKFQTQRQITGAFISDPNSEVIDAFALRNPHHDEGSFAYGIPHPAIFIISPDKVIRAKLYENDYMSDRRSYENRPASSIILAEIDALAQ